MGRSRSNTRRTASARPRGILSLKRGGYGFVQTAEGEYFILVDKRESGEDSRYYGMVKEKEIKGSVVTIIRRNNL